MRTTTPTMTSLSLPSSLYHHPQLHQHIHLVNEHENEHDDDEVGSSMCLEPGGLSGDSKNGPNGPRYAFFFFLFYVQTNLFYYL